MDSIPSPSLKIQIMGGKVYLGCKGKTLSGVVLKTEKLLTSPSNVLPSHLKQTFLPIIWIFNEGDEFKSMQPYNIFSTLKFIYSEKATNCWRNLYHGFAPSSNGQIYDGNFAKFCCLLRIHELYHHSLFRGVLPVFSNCFVKWIDDSEWNHIML